MRNNTNEQPDEQIDRESSRRVLRAGTSVPVELGSTTGLSHGCVHQPKKLSKPHTLGIFMEASSVWHSHSPQRMGMELKVPSF